MYSTTMPFYHIRVTEHAQYAIEAKNFSALQVFLSAIMIILSVTNALLGSVQSSGEVLTQLICSIRANILLSECQSSLWLAKYRLILLYVLKHRIKCIYSLILGEMFC